MGCPALSGSRQIPSTGALGNFRCQRNVASLVQHENSTQAITSERLKRGTAVAKKPKAELDTAQTLDIDGSASQFAGSLVLTILACLGVAAAVWLNLDILTSMALIALLIGTALLAGLSALLARLMFRSTGPIVTISPEGVCDRRMSKDTVMWRDIKDIRTRRLQQVPVIEFLLTDEAEKALKFTPLPNLLRTVGWLSRKVRYSVSAHGLKVGHQQLLETLQAYLKAHRPPPD